ncbi:hypothetical protein KKH39_01735 [Patescibacteria group bacterium]|nr:hypothetical protein [Patescibacteria group bacterium]
MESILKQLGFSDNEAKVYLAALGLGKASAQDIAKQASLKRTTVYSVLDYLIERGVIGKSTERGKTRFVAEAPDKLLAMTDQLREKIKKALPELEAVYNKSESKPKIVFYEGKEAIQNIYDDTLREKPDAILEWNTNAYFERFPKDHAYIDKRVKLNIQARRIAGEGSVWHTKHKGYDKSELSETIVVPKDKFWPMIEVNIYNNKVAFMNYADEMSVVIENKAIAEAMKQIYELSWQGAKKIEVN